jgi:protein-S-isoprenylcysteine O-methyltransferase Ste14
MKTKRFHAYLFVTGQMIILFFLIFLKNNIGLHIQSSATLGLVLKTIGAAGLISTAGSLRRTLTAIPIPKESGKLSTSGLYRFARHPMYTALLIFSLGMAIGGGSAIKYALFLGLLILLYFKSRFEEGFLIQKYPDYKEYSNRTPRFFPGFH